jgi:hypothetical protein
MEEGSVVTVQESMHGLEPLVRRSNLQQGLPASRNFEGMAFGRSRC